MEFVQDRYYKPEELNALVSIDNDTIPDNQFFTSQNQPIREAWCAAKFGIGFCKCIGPCEVKVNSGDFPDFFLRYNDIVFDFENTEFLKQGRHRTSEYRNASNNSMAIRHSVARIDVLKGVKQAIVNKIDKYRTGAKSINLLIYVDVYTYSLDINEMREACSEYKNTFQSIWILTGGHVGTLFIEEAYETKLGKIDGFVRYV